MNRRDFSKLALAWSSLCSAFPQMKAEATAPGLKDVCGSSRRVGVWLDGWMLQSEILVPLLVANFNHAMIGTLKWDFLSKTNGPPDFHKTDELVAFCKANHFTMHGHNLCWNASYPGWLPQALAAGNPRRMLEAHITTVMSRYKGVITSYDVVNEPIATWMERDDGLYKGPWLTALGPEYIDIAFHAAHAADPAAMLVLNTAHDEQVGDNKARGKTLALLESLLKRGVPVQALGMESHLNSAAGVAPDEDRKQFISAVRGLGLKVLITELDVNDTQFDGTVKSRDAAVAAYYHDYLTAMLAEAKPEWVSFFCFTDAHNWYDAVTGPGFTRPDGTPHRPGLLDAFFVPKPAYASVAAALRTGCGTRA